MAVKKSRTCHWLNFCVAFVRIPTLRFGDSTTVDRQRGMGEEKSILIANLIVPRFQIFAFLAYGGIAVCIPCGTTARLFIGKG